MTDSGQTQVIAAGPGTGTGMDRRALAAASVTVVLWASAFVAIRSGGRYFDPGALALGRLLTGSVVLVVVWLVRGGGWPPRAAWPGIACTGVLWFGVYMVALNWGEPAVVIVMSLAFLGQSPRPLAYAGGVLCLAGVAVSRARPRSSATSARTPGPPDRRQ